MDGQRIVFRVHAIRRMFERRIGRDDVIQILQAGEEIESYPDDTPYPSSLIMGPFGNRVLHVVAAHNIDDDEIIVITVYEPDPALWTDDFRRRKTQ